MVVDWLLALSPLAVALAVWGVFAPVYVRLGRLEAMVKSGGERTDARNTKARERG